MNTIIKKTPIDHNSLPELLKAGSIYVDKTQSIYQLIHDSYRLCLFTRPRRFGKSLLVSTLKEVFLGNQELFKHTWIAEHGDYEWQTHPVIHLDLSSVDSSTPETLVAQLSQRLDTIAAAYDLSIVDQVGLSPKLHQLITLLAQRGHVVLLIDEYDHPLTTHMDNQELVQANMKALTAFYSTLKSINHLLRFLFLTGVSKYPQTSIFSGLNNVTDISFTPEYSALVGYTEQEITQYYQPTITAIATKQQTTPAAIRTMLREWYNGYRFSTADIRVYNPYSILHYLQDTTVNNYWYKSGTPSFLVALLKQGNYTVGDLQQALTFPSTLQVLSSTLTLDNLLYQTGYLTIKSAQENLGGALYYLMYPNNEVRLSMQQCLLAYFTSAPTEEIPAFASLLNAGFTTHNIELFVSTLGRLLAKIPYDAHIEKEAYYHSILQVIGELIGIDTRSEVHTSIGRVDLVLQSKNTVFVIELKCNSTAEIALAQIKDRRYHEQFMTPGKTIFLIGLAFNFPKKVLTTSWTYEEIKASS